jgi:hypothetical protein
MLSSPSSPPTTQVREIRSPGGSVCGRAEAIYAPIHRQRDANRVGNIETNRPQLNHDATLDEHNPLDAMRLRVVEPNNITSP